MADINEIEKAIGAHGMWKTRLKTAIDSGQIDTPVETIKKDNQCAFGKWLYGSTLTASDKTSEHYRQILDLHAEFHRIAGQVVELALQGKRKEAEQMMSLNGAYSSISAKLTKAMIDWKKISK